MSIPPFNWFFRPILAVLAQVGVSHTRDFRAKLAAQSGLSAAELAERIPSGQFTVFESRTGWARSYLFKAGLSERVSRGTYRITDKGRRALEEYPDELTITDLEKDPEFKAWHKRKPERANGAQPVDSNTGERDPEPTPETMIELESQMRRLVEEELRERIAAMTWTRFEWLVEQLVVKLGYGASASEVAGALRNTGADEGIDGVIHEDRLGLGQIYLQAKKWQATVGRPDLQKFVGAMHGRAKKGVFLTTSAFSSEATQYAKSLHDIRLRLVNGRELASLMIDCGLGVSEEQVYKTYRIDSDFFEESD